MRSVQIWPALHEDLELWRSRCRSVAAEEPIICDSRGRAWGVYTFGNWRKRIFHPAAARAGVPNARPYDLRHFFCSMLIARGLPITLVAQQSGHSVRAAMRFYQHLIQGCEVGFDSDIDSEVQSARAAAQSNRTPLA